MNADIFHTFSNMLIPSLITLLDLIHLLLGSDLVVSTMGVRQMASWWQRSSYYRPESQDLYIGDRDLDVVKVLIMSKTQIPLIGVP